MANLSLAEKRLNQAVDLLSLTTIIAIFYTLVFILYCLSFRLSYAQLRNDRGKIERKTVCILVFQTVLLICATLDIIVCNRRAQAVYVDRLSAPLGPSAGYSKTNLVKIDAVLNTVEDLLILGVLLWRVWVIGSGSCFIIPLTVASLFFYLADAGLVIVYRAITWNDENPNLAATPRTREIIGIMILVFSIASSLFMTSTIIARLLFIRQKHVQLLGKSDVARQYFSIAAMLVESYALDSLWTVGILISFVLKYAPTMNLFNNCITQVDILTNFLLIYRVLSGRAWTRRTHDRLSSLRWASDGAGTTTSGTVGLCQTGHSSQRESYL